MSKFIKSDIFWTREYVDSMPDYLFVYGDNDIKKGKGGQAIIRGASNSIGVPTKKKPSMGIDSFYTDTEYDQNVEKINIAYAKIIEKGKKYKGIIISSFGYGTGLAKLNEYAPKTLKYINELFGL